MEILQQIAELQMKIAEKEEEIEKNVEAKNFELASGLNAEVEKLKEQIDNIKNDRKRIRLSTGSAVSSIAGSGLSKISNDDDSFIINPPR